MNLIGRKIIRLESVDSTNNYTANAVKDGKAVHGTVILAVEQYAGRGQRNATWLANPGENLTFSIFWDKVNLSVNEQFHINRLFSLALIELLKTYEIPAQIKWPNDIYAEERKIAGILIENQVMGQMIKCSIIGIGLNINQSSFSGVNGTSMALVKGKKFSTDDILFAFFNVLNKLSGGGTYIPSDLVDRYTDQLMLLNQPSEYEDEEGMRFTGIIRGVEDNGRLILEREGELRTYNLKELCFILQNA